MTKTHKKIIWTVTGIVLAALALFLAAGLYFFNVAEVPGKKTFVSNGTVRLKKSTPLYAEKKWYRDVKKQHWTMMSANNKYRLAAYYLPTKKSKKTVIVLHGFMSNKENMGAYAQLWATMSCCLTRRRMDRARASTWAMADWRKLTCASGASR